MKKMRKGIVMLAVAAAVAVGAGSVASGGSTSAGPVKTGSGIVIPQAKGSVWM